MKYKLDIKEKFNELTKEQLKEDKNEYE